MVRYVDAQGRNLLANERVSPSVVASNIVRGAALHIGPMSPAVSEGVENAALALLAAMGEKPSDPATTFAGTSFAIPRKMPTTRPAAPASIVDQVPA